MTSVETLDGSAAPEETKIITPPPPPPAPAVPGAENFALVVVAVQDMYLAATITTPPPAPDAPPAPPFKKTGVVLEAETAQPLIAWNPTL